MIVTCRAQLTAWTGCSCSVRQALYTAQHFTAPLETHDPRSGRCALENIQYISRHFPMYFITIANYVEKKKVCYNIHSFIIFIDQPKEKKTSRCAGFFWTCVCCHVYIAKNETSADRRIWCTVTRANQTIASGNQKSKHGFNLDF